MTKIAIIGASSNRSKYANKCVRAYIERGDTVYPIHPAQPEVEGLKTYRSVLDVPGDIDIASFYVAPNVGLRIIEEVAQKGIPQVILNPGAQSDELLQRAEQLGVKAKVACTIIMAGRSPSEFSEV